MAKLLKNRIPKKWLQLQDLPVPAALVDPTGVIIYRNPAWANLDPIEGRAFVWPLEFVARVQECLEAQHSTVVRSVQARNENGTYDLWVGPFGEAINEALILAVDISAYYQDEVSKLVEAEVRNASIVIRGILHEMRNPLAGIRAGLQLMQRHHKKDKKLVDDIQQILGDVTRIDGLFEELVLLGSVMTLNRKSTNLHRLLDEAIDNVKNAANEKGVVIERHYDPSLPEIEVDSDRMYRVYLNLLLNAVQATHPSTTILVQTRFQRTRWGISVDGRHRIQGSAWVVEILDQGDGIKNADRSALFTPLYTTKRDGSGLGLPISLQIVQAHGGLLTLENRKESGACATIALPITKHNDT